jgi:uncharacterized membrane protein
MRGWRLPATAAAFVAYAVVSNWLMIRAPERGWTAALLFGPWLVAMTIAGLKRRHAPTLVLAILISLALVLVVAPGGATDVRRLYVLQHGALHAFLAWSFALTLRPGSKALITAIAERVHVQFTPEMRAYTRWLTGIWAIYFVAMIAVSLLIYAFAPWEWWSFFGNLVTPLAALSLFAGEHFIRYRRHPEFERATLAPVLRSWRARRAADAR